MTEIEKLNRTIARLQKELAHARALSTRHSGQWPLAKSQRLAYLIAEGYTAPEIAIKMKLTLNQVHGKARNMGLKSIMVKRNIREWTEAEKQALLAFCAAGGRPGDMKNGRTQIANTTKYHQLTKGKKHGG